VAQRREDCAQRFDPGVAVGGMAPKEAKSALYKKYAPLRVRLATPEKVYNVGLKDMGGHVAIDRAVQSAFWLGTLRIAARERHRGVQAAFRAEEAGTGNQVGQGAAAPPYGGHHGRVPS
jgi:hypothetical protein